ncbi:NIPSNAP family protein [Psychromonas sp. KJ10-10]|uniref:NIPSNAP family protein n=1 Tax=Psychromonas sp. KJ10-10 TaxID=3391823 RepID=UPI0039B4EA19
MITCYIEYVIDANKINEFEHYARLWIPLVNKFGGKHLGYFLPSEGVNNKAFALFNFSSLATYEKYRQQSFKDADCISAFDYAKKTQCIKQYQRSFFRPLLNEKE